MYLHKILFYITIIVHLKYDSCAYYLTVRQPRRGIFQLRSTTRRFDDIRETIILLLFCKSNSPPVLIVRIYRRRRRRNAIRPSVKSPPHFCFYNLLFLFFSNTSDRLWSFPLLHYFSFTV